MLPCHWRTHLTLLGLLSLALGLAANQNGLAAKPGGGGGGGTVPAGTIFFQQWPAGFDSTPRSMLADGSGKTNRPGGEPSYRLHEDTRWFLASRDVTTDPDVSEYELIVTGDNGVVVPFGGRVSDYMGGRWAKDDSFLSYEAILDGSAGQSAGVFVALVDWSLGLPIIGEPVQVLTINLVDGFPDIYFGDWSPLGNEYVHVRQDTTANGDSDYSLEIVEFFADGTIETRGLVTDAFAYAPQWSPDGTRIAYQGSEGIWTIRPDGTAAVKVSSPKWPTVHYEPSWSPDSQSLAFTERVRKQKGAQPATYVYDVLRIAANGGATTNLTGDTTDNCFAIGWR